MPTDLPILQGLLATPHRFLWHPTSRSAIFADFHLGIAETLSQQGIAMLDRESEVLHARWKCLKAYDPARVIVAGDLFDSPRPSERAVGFCRELLSEIGCPVTITPGNHDPESEVLEELLTGLPVTIVPNLMVERVLISHGHDLTLGEAGRHPADIWIVGHQHPALTLATRVQHAKMPCYAVCRLSGRVGPGHLMVLPAFSPGPLGSNLLVKGNWLLPVERPANDQIEIFGLIESPTREPQVLPFGPLSMHETA